MQWIFMLVGLVLGVGSSESVTGALLGGLIGLSLGQALRLQGLETRNAQLAAQRAGDGPRWRHPAAPGSALAGLGRGLVGTGFGQ